MLGILGFGNCSLINDDASSLEEADENVSTDAPGLAVSAVWDTSSGATHEVKKSKEPILILIDKNLIIRTSLEVKQVLYVS
ncbi:MAG: hypothetical protein JWM56_262 [Candidatus Peribacteria bacterium]|nr:hypothetical protein [Candidatus Peribacteria bacterium]